MKTNLKIIFFFAFIIAGHYWVNGQEAYKVIERKKGKPVYSSSYVINEKEKFEVVKFEERSNKYFYSIEISGAVYISPDSIAMYLYEPLFKSMILYELRTENGTTYGKQIGRRKEISVRLWENVIFVEYGKVKTKLYLK